MKRILSILFILHAFGISAQYSEEYQLKVIAGDSLYQIKEYKKSARAYSDAFASNNNRAFFIHRYNAACSYALYNNIDSAFLQLQNIVENSGYHKIEHIRNDKDLGSLHNDERWSPLLEQIKLNKAAKFKYLEPELVQMLDSVYRLDQDVLMEQRALAEQYGWDSEEVKSLRPKIEYNQSITEPLVTKLLDERGWLGPEVVGSRGSSALFLVIQHSNLETQQKYLPMMVEAVKNRKASGSSLALLQDRVNLKTGKKQIYGSQIGRMEDESNYVRALEDPLNVDKRRTEVGLEPLNDYTQNWNFSFSAKEYMKKLPEYEKILKEEFEASKKVGFSLKNYRFNFVKE